MKHPLVKKMLAVSVSATLAFTPLISNACTSFLLKGNDNGYVYGRTMEFGLSLKSQLTLIPKNTAMQGVSVDSKPGTGLNWTAKYTAAGMYEWLRLACAG